MGGDKLLVPGTTEKRKRQTVREIMMRSHIAGVLALALSAAGLPAQHTSTFAAHPAAAAQAIAKHILNVDSVTKQEFSRWGYGASLLLDSFAKHDGRCCVLSLIHI